MRNATILILSLLAMLAACSASSDTAKKNTDLPPATQQMAVAIPSAGAETSDPASAKEPDRPKEVKPIVTFIELGAESCIPCKMMQPILKEVQTEYQGLVDVVFYDLYKNREAGPKYKVRVMPTQVFLDAEGREFFRHEGFYPKAEIETMLADKAGVKKPQ